MSRGRREIIISRGLLYSGDTFPEVSHQIFLYISLVRINHLPIPEPIIVKENQTLRHPVDVNMQSGSSETHSSVRKGWGLVQNQNSGRKEWGIIRVKRDHVETGKG